MNIRALANSATQLVNPNVAATALKSVGSVTATDGSRAPTWQTSPVIIQAQGIPSKELQFLAGQGIAGVLRQVIAPGYWAAPQKVGGTGGDMFRFPAHPGGGLRDWKIVQIKGTYEGWTQAIVQMQTALVAASVDAVLLLYLWVPNLAAADVPIGDDTEIGDDTIIRWKFLLPADVDIRAATGWVSGVGNIFYDAAGDPVAVLASEIAAWESVNQGNILFHLVSAETETGRLVIYTANTPVEILDDALEALRGILLYLGEPNLAAADVPIGDDAEIGDDTIIRWKFLLPADVDIRAATGWVSGVGNIFYDAAGDPIAVLASEIAAWENINRRNILFHLVDDDTETGRLVIYAQGTPEGILENALEALKAPVP